MHDTKYITNISYICMQLATLDYILIAKLLFRDIFDASPMCMHVDQLFLIT